MDGVIVLMDYSEYDREKAKSVLGSMGGFTMVEVTTAEQYVELTHTIRGIDLIIMDIAFPTESQGLEILSSIRNNTATARVPVIITSRMNNLELRNTAALQFGVNDYIVKPYTAKRLEKSVGSLIKLESKFSYSTDNAGNITMSFKQFITKELKFADRMKHPLSILLITPCDRMKESPRKKNSAHPVNEEVLIEICEKAKTLLRSTDTVILSGDTDILVVLPGTDGTGANTVVERLKKCISQHLENINVIFDEHFFFAVVTYPEDGNDFQSLMESAFKKISHREMLQKISTIPMDTREYASRIYNKFKGFYF